VLLHGQLVRLAEQVNRLLNIGRFPDVKADPAAVGQNVMGLRLSGGHQVTPYFGWEGDIKQVIAVNVTNFSFAQAKDTAVKTMRLGGHAIPLQYRFSNLFTRAFN
jgi:hypothetical protein